jgi:hypothetical protein
VTVAYQREITDNPDTHVTLDAGYARCYLFAVGERVSIDAIMVGNGGPIGWNPPAKAGPTVAISAPLGPVAGGGCHPPVVHPPGVQGPDPELAIRPRALRRDGRIIVARVFCPAPCTLRMTVSDGHRTVRRALWTSGPTALALPRATRLRPGLLRVRVSVDDYLLGEGKPRLAR